MESSDIKNCKKLLPNNFQFETATRLEMKTLAFVETGQWIPIMNHSTLVTSGS